MAGQLLEPARFVGLDAEEAQFQLGRGPGQIHRPINRVRIAVFAHQGEYLLARWAAASTRES